MGNKQKRKSKPKNKLRQSVIKDRHQGDFENEDALLAEEITALSAIFQEDFNLISDRQAKEFSINLRAHSDYDGEFTAQLIVRCGFAHLFHRAHSDYDGEFTGQLIVRCLPGYPWKAPKFQIVVENDLLKSEAERLHLFIPNDLILGKIIVILVHLGMSFKERSSDMWRLWPSLEVAKNSKRQSRAQLRSEPGSHCGLGQTSPLAFCPMADGKNTSATGEDLDEISAKHDTFKEVIAELLWVPRTHHITKGNTLWSLSQKFQVSIPAIQAANGIDDPVFAGDILVNLDEP